MYQSTRSFNIPSGNTGHLNFWKIFVQIPPHQAEKLFKCSHPRENYQITVQVSLFSSFYYVSEAVHVNMVY